MTDVLLSGREELHQIQTAALIGDTLEKTYPGWGWQVVPYEEDVMKVTNIGMTEAIRKQTGKSGDWGFVIFTNTTPDDLKRKVVMAGGEILERCHQSRGAWSESKVIEKVDM